MLREFLKEHLLRRPTPFPWLAVLLLPVMLFYAVFGIFGLLKGTEASMALLMLPYLLPKMAFLLLVDLFLRRLTKRNLRSVCISEGAIILSVGAWYVYMNLRITEFVTKGSTPFVVMVEDPGGASPSESMLGLKTTYTCGEDNVIVTDRPPKDSEWKRLKARTVEGERYSQVYSMTYMDTSRNRSVCDGQVHRVWFFMLESDRLPRFDLTPARFDSIEALVCKNLERHRFR